MTRSNIKINENYLNLKESYLFSDIKKRVAAFGAKYPDAELIRMGVGDVTLPIAGPVARAMQRACAELGGKETFRGYPPEFGYDFVREAIAAYYAGFGVNVAADEVFVSDGAKCDVGNLTEIFGDNPVLIPDPVYPAYLDSNIMAGRRVGFLKGSDENGFLPMPDGLDEDAYIVYLCSPNNPTGAVYTAAQLKVWVDFANRTGSVIIYDNAYEAFIRGDFPHSIFEIEGARVCAIEVSSLSKTAGFTGVRCGWTVVPSQLRAGDVTLKSLWERRQSTKFNGVSYPVQRAAEAALSPEGVAASREQVSYYLENAGYIRALLDGKGMRYTGGDSSPYIWMKCPAGMGSWDFFDFLLERAQVVGTPGSGFGACGEGWFRLTSFAERESVTEGVRRLQEVL
ncbi:MAG: LL-diaminopimelate aminotransferase [Clostridiales Family XIII bacterium]|jgi:LL-diaminopimelate aminotransferase|nr:LL-diaminopimelate aminotransferase [Clostridiales Family XIII bacterium]